MDDKYVPHETVATAKPETKHELPQSGGSWTRNADGTLTQVTHPTKVPAQAPVFPDAKPGYEPIPAPVPAPEVKPQE